MLTTNSMISETPSEPKKNLSVSQIRSVNCQFILLGSRGRERLLPHVDMLAWTLSYAERGVKGCGHANKVSSEPPVCTNESAMYTACQSSVQRKPGGRCRTRTIAERQGMGCCLVPTVVLTSPVPPPIALSPLPRPLCRAEGCRGPLFSLCILCLPAFSSQSHPLQLCCRKQGLREALHSPLH